MHMATRVFIGLHVYQDIPGYLISVSAATAGSDPLYITYVYEYCI